METNAALPPDLTSTGAPPPHDAMAYFAQADAVGLTVLAILVLMSVATWSIIVAKSLRYLVQHRYGKRFMRQFWAATSFDEAFAALLRNHSRDPFSMLVRDGVAAETHFVRQRVGTLGEACSRSEFLTRALRNTLSNVTARLESGLTLLASVGSTAPFIGLFGTVWGIYHALVRIGMTGSTSIDQVAGPVGEALIMTAAGLVVAIPAVLAYNAMVRTNRIVLAELDAAAHDLHAYFTSGARIHAVDGGANPATAMASTSAISRNADARALA
jgi:biopolymer transport protein ExbB